MEDLLLLKVEEIIWETPTAITLKLREKEGKEVFYRAGQFLTLVLNINGKELRRSYSLCSSPGIDDQLSITIQRVENGEVSRFLIDNIKVGEELTSLYPAGRFVLAPQPLSRRDIFLIGAGSGITPLFSLLKYILKTQPLSSVIFINSNKSESTTFYYREIETLQVLNPGRLKVINFYSNPAPKQGVYPQRLNIGEVENIVSQHLSFDPLHTQFFICGPYEYMRMVRMALIFMKFHDEQIHRENFVAKSATVVLPPVDTATKMLKATLGNRDFEIAVPFDKTILRAALAVGVAIPYSCEAGICGTCVAKCTSGEVTMSRNEVLTEKEVKSGLLLTCVSYCMSKRVEIIV